ncbi:hypothetical protein GCM10027570_14770 [Streptomonospora sediminis]
MTSADAADFRVLGLLDVRVAGTPVPTPAPRQRVVLVSLLLRPGRVVGADEIIERLWGSEAADGARTTLRSYVMRLRRELAGSGIPAQTLQTRTEGYLIDIRPEQVDLHRFHTLVERADAARDRGDTAAEHRLVDEALAVPHGSALADVSSESLHRDVALPFEERRLQLLERSFAAALERGDNGPIIPRLQALTSRHPLRERFSEQLMTALYRTGRQAEALSHYHRVSGLLADELGADPGPRLQRLFEALLRQDPAETGGPVSAPAHSGAEPAPADRGRPAARPSATARRGAASGRPGRPEQSERTAPPGPPRPAQRPEPAPHQPVPSGAPPALPDFVGRTAEAETAARVIAAGRGSVGLPIAVITGPPGVGKTALALQVAHTLGNRFPDGRLHADLRGYAQEAALRPSRVLARFLKDLGVAAERIPADVEEQTALFRSVLAERRVLVLLDNAADAEQIRPLLPSGPGCAVIATSRNDLRGLTLNGAVLIRLAPFGRREALQLLAATLGEAALHAEPDAADELAELCGRIPLALRIASANILACGGIAEYAAELRGSGRLGALYVEGDPKAAVRAAFDISHAAVGAGERALFAALGLLPGPDFTPATAAVLADCAPAHARSTLDRLAAHHLIDPHAPGRYRFHDLLGEYAAEQARETMAESECAAALERVYLDQLDTAEAAARLLAPDARRMPRPAPAAAFADTGAAMTWLDAEYTNLLATIEDAAARGPANRAWHLADALRTPFSARTMLSEWQQAASTGLRAARASGDPAARAAMLHNVGSALWNGGDLQQAAAHLEEALELFGELGDTEGEIAVLNNLAPWHVWGGRIDRAIELFERGVRLCDEQGLEAQGAVLEGNLGAACESVDLPRAQRSLRAALDRLQRLDLPGREGLMLGSLASVKRNSGEPAAALDLAHQAIRLLEQPARELQLLPVLVDVGRVHAERGDPATARRIGAQAVERCVAAGARRIEADARTGLAAACMADGDAAGAAVLFDEALAISEQSGYRFGAAEARIGLGWSQLESGDAATARAHAERAAHLSQGAHRILEGRAATLRAAVELVAGDRAQAARLAEHAAGLHRDTGARPGEAWALQVAAEAAARLDGPAAAEAAAERAEHARRAADIPPQLFAGLPRSLHTAEQAYRDQDTPAARG